MEKKQTSKLVRWASYVMQWLVILFMLFDSIIKFVKPEPVIQSTVNELGYQYHHIDTLAVIGLVSTILYMIPRTAVLGAICLTAQFGGAIASHLRVDNPLLSHTLFPVYIALLMWGSLWLRDENIRKLLLYRKSSS